MFCRFSLQGRNIALKKTQKTKQERKQKFPILSAVAVCQTTLSDSLTIIPIQGF